MGSSNCMRPRSSCEPWRLWVAVYGLFCLVTAARLRFFPLDRGSRIDPRLKPMLDVLDRERARNAWRMVPIAIASFAVSVPILLLPRSSPWPQGLALACGIVTGLWSANGLRGMHRQREMLARMLREITPAPAP